MNKPRFTKLAANVLAGLAALTPGLLHSGLVYNDTFQTYPVQSPAPNPLTNGPAGGQWYYLDPTPPAIGANEHRIFDSGNAGSALQSRVWVSNQDNATITNAIAIPALPTATNTHYLTLRFLVATETSDTSRAATFKYEIGSSAGPLQFVSGGSLDASRLFSGLSGEAIAPAGPTGKSDDRKFSITFSSSDITTADRIFLALTRVNNAGAPGAFLAVDDVSIDIAFGPPVVVQQPVSLTAVAGEAVAFEAVFTNFPHAYQWFKNGEPITAAVNPRLSIPFVTKPDEGSYVLWATNTEGVASTAAATLTVADTVPPSLVSAAAQLTLEHARLRFSEPVDPETATNTTHYAVTPAVAVQAAWMIDARTVELHTGALAPNSSYAVSVSGVRDLGGNPVAADASIAFTTPDLVVSAVRYDAGEGAPDPTSAAGGYWTLTANTNVGMAAVPVLNDVGTGVNAWGITDQNISGTSGILDYRMPVDPVSDELARTEGWRLLVHSRMTTDFSGTASPVVLYSSPGVPRRYGLLFDLNADGYLTVALLGGATYVVPGDPAAYHTHVLAYDSLTATAAYYFDGQLIDPSYTGQPNAAYDGVVFGTGSGGGSGEMNFNRVQLDVVGGSVPRVTLHPQDSVNGVGQRVTFTAGFAPFVAGYQWLANDVLIPGATNSSYTTPFVTLAMNGTRYKARALHALGNVETAPATLTVTSDTKAPTVASFRTSPLLDRLFITFSEPVQALQATNTSNYVWANPGVTNRFAAMVDALTVEVRTTPQESSSNYVLLLRNIRDTSNLAISNDTPVALTTPTLSTLALYDAGSTISRPAGPPDPVSPEGGSWQLVLGTDPGLLTNAVVNDLGTGLHAWQVSDETTGGAQFIQYNFPITPEQNAALRSNGWLLTIHSRFVEDFGSSFAVMAQLGEASGRRILLWFDRDPNGNLLTRMGVGAGGTDAVLTTDSIGAADYHLHQLLFDPVTTNASYYFDGQFIGSWPGDASTAAFAGIQWGTGSSPGLGQMNFNRVELKMIHPPALPTVSIRAADGFAEVSYTGVLESATTLVPQPDWTPVATNAEPAAVDFLAPAVERARFFRARGR